MTRRNVHVYWISGDSDAARKHVVLALRQAEQDQRREVTFGKLCSTPGPVFYWKIDRGICIFGMPAGLGSSEVRRVLTAMVGFDSGSEFPKQSELRLQAGERHDDWLVLQEAPQSQIVLKRI